MKKNIFLLLSACITLNACKKSSTDPGPQNELKYFTRFSTYDNTWFNNDSTYSIHAGNPGYYEMQQNKPDYQSFGIAPFGTISYNYSISADGWIWGTNSYYYGATGIVFNYIDDTHYYAFYVGSNGNYWVFKNNGGSFSTLIQSTFCSAIKTTDGSINHMEVQQYDGTASFYVNGTSLGSCPATRANVLLRVGVAVSTASNPYFTPVTADFTNVTITKLN